MHPQTNGKAERFVRFLNNSLSIVSNEDQSDWDEALYCCLFAYRTTIHRVIQETPFFLLYGRDVVLPSDLIYDLPGSRTYRRDHPTKTDYKIDLLAKLKNAYESIIFKRELAVNDLKERYDSKHKNIQFNEGDQVMLFLPIRRKGFSEKLLPKFDGPYSVVKKIGVVTYRIQKGNKTMCVHVQRLRHYHPW